MQHREDSSTIHSPENTWCNHAPWSVSGCKRTRTDGSRILWVLGRSTAAEETVEARERKEWGKGTKKIKKKKAILSFGSTTASVSGEDFLKHSGSIRSCDRPRWQSRRDIQEQASYYKNLVPSFVDNTNTRESIWKNNAKMKCFDVDTAGYLSVMGMLP